MASKSKKATMLEQQDDNCHSNVNANDATKKCTIIGHSIGAITTATVMASLEHKVTLYADQQALKHTVTNYTFEHQLNALWKLYIGQQQIEVLPVPNSASEVFSSPQLTQTEQAANHTAVSLSDANKSNNLIWVFYTELPDAWRNKNDGIDDWVNELNQSQLSMQVPVVLSGIDTLGTFAKIASNCLRPWVFYVPFVFLQDGRTYTSMLSPTLWLMGEKTKDSAYKTAALQSLMAHASNKYISDIATIEFARSAIMSMLATRVSFMNEWSRLADTQGVDITEVADIMGLDTRVGKSYLHAGWGFGGQTLPAEIEALTNTLADTQLEHRLIQVVKDINDDQKELIFRKFWQYFDGRIEDKSVCIWGASYKAGSGRTSSAAIHPLLRLLWSFNIKTYIYAVEAEPELASIYPNEPLLHFMHEPTAQLANADSLFILAWPQTKRLPITAINDVALPVFDAQNIFTKAQINALIGDYKGIGRSK